MLLEKRTRDLESSAFRLSADVSGLHYALSQPSHKIGTMCSTLMRELRTGFKQNQHEHTQIAQMLEELSRQNTHVIATQVKHTEQINYLSSQLGLIDGKSDLILKKLGG